MKGFQRVKNLINKKQSNINNTFSIFNKINYNFFSTKQNSYVIKNGIVVNADEKFHGDVYIKNGKILSVIRKENNNFNNNIHKNEVFKEINANGNYIIPGGIDPHTHMELPFMGTISVDDFNHGSKAALAGGTTSFIDFIIPDKNQSLLKGYENWRKLADPKVNCDYSLHCAITSFNENTKNEMKQIVDLGISSFKIFLAYKGALMLNDSELYQVLNTCKELGAICMVHAENGDLLSEAQEKMLKLGITGPEAHYLSRPESFEAEATHKAITIAEYVNSPLYIVHVMSKDAGEEVQRGRNKGNILYSETLASALGIDGTKIWNEDFDIAAGNIMSPPINPDPRTKIELMRMLQSGVIHTVATDNCTFCRSQKRMGLEDFTKIPNGVNGIEDRLSIVWTKGVKEGLLSISDFVKVTSTNAAQIFNLYPKKGVIREGADADIVIWAGDEERIISRFNHHHKVDFNIFEGMKVKGVNKMTMSNGRIVWQHGSFTNDLRCGLGSFIPRKPFGFSFERLKDLDEVKNPLRFKVDRSPDKLKNKTEKIIEELETLDHKTAFRKMQKKINELEDRNKFLENELDKRIKNENLINNDNELSKHSNKTNNNSNNNETELFEDNELISIEKVFDKYISSKNALKEIKRIIYGTNCRKIEINKKSSQLALQNNFEIKAYQISAAEEQLRSKRIVRIGAVQNRIVLPTTEPILNQVSAIHDRVQKIIEAAYHSKVNIICLQECWTAPFFYCTREKYPWVESAEDAKNGMTTNFLKKLAKEYNMVIISPILERDDKRNTLWNTAVVIDNDGNYLGKAHKNHIPRVGDFNESTYYFEGETGNPVFETSFGKIGINICYGRHHPLHWMALGLNGAEIVFNPSATVAGLSEQLWLVEARNAAIANSYFAVGINRIGTEVFQNEFTSADGKKAHNDFGHFYGSSYVASPDGSVTPQLSRTKDGLLITEVDLNLIRQVRDKWAFHMTMRPKMYADLLNDYCKPDFKKQIIQGKKI